MLMKTSSLTVIVAVGLMLFTPSISAECKETEVSDDGHCPYFNLTQGLKDLCSVFDELKTDLDLFVKVTNPFLIVRIQEKPKKGKPEVFNISTFLPVNEWQHLKMNTNTDGSSEESTIYQLSIDGIVIHNFTETYTNPRVYVIYQISVFATKDSSCNPADKQTDASSTATTKSTHAITSSTFDSTPYPADPSEDTASSKYVIIAVVVFIIICVVITAIVMYKKRKGKFQNRTRLQGEDGGRENRTFSGRDLHRDHIQAPGIPNYSGNRDPDTNIYDEPNAYKEEHIYETIEDVECAAISGGADDKKPSSSHNATLPRDDTNLNQSQTGWQSRRSSAHDSENSLYGCVTQRTA